MTNRFLIAVMATLTLTSVATFAQERVTLTLRSGDRLTGDLVDLNGSGLVMRVNGDERGVAVGDVAVIEFTPSGQPAAVRPWLEAGRPFILLRDGSAVEGRLVDVGGTHPLRLSVDTPGGSRELTSADVAQIYLSRPPGLAAAGGETGGAASGPKNRPAMGPDLARGGTGTVTVSGTHNWSPTNIMVRRNESIAFKSEGLVQLSANADDRVPPAGAPGGQQGVGPLPSAPRGALIARVNDGPPFLIGAGGNIRIPAEGRLVLGINDDHVGDNGGEFQVIVGINPRSR